MRACEEVFMLIITRITANVLAGWVLLPGQGYVCMYVCIRKSGRWEGAEAPALLHPLPQLDQPRGSVANQAITPQNPGL